MPATKAAPERKRLRLTAKNEALIVVYPWNQYRFLLDDGTTVDVVAVRDDSELRAAVLDETKAARIEGVATVVVGMQAP